MIKVCHVTCVHDSSDTRVFQKECVTLAAAGYDVYLVAPGEDREERGVRVVGIGPKPVGTLRRIKSGFAGKAYRKALSLDCQIYHIHDPELLPYARKLKRHGKVVIFDSHEFYSLLIEEKAYIPAPLKKTAGRVYSALEKAIVRKLDAVVVPCTVDQKNLFEGYARRTAIIDNLPLAEEFMGMSEPAPDTENTVGYLGGVTYERGVTHLVKACAAAGAKLRLAGPVWPAYLEELRAMPEFQCAEYVGVVPFREVGEFCKSIRVGMCTLLSTRQYGSIDNLPTKVYEYMGAGLPVILSDTRAARQMEKEYGGCICVDPENVSQIAAAIRTLLDDPTRAKRVGENGYRAVTEKYNWTREGEKLVSLYRELIP